MKRGDIVTVALSGDYGKPRPAVVVQSDVLTQADSQSVVVCLLTSQLEPVRSFRMMLQPSAANGLEKPSQIMVDKLFTLSRQKVGQVVGSLTKRQQQELNGKLALVVGLV
jgi:mRNA interferase MazF